ATGQHRLAVWGNDDELIGWTAIEVIDEGQEPSPTPTDDPDPTGDPTDDPTDDATDDATDDPAADPALSIAPEVIGVSAFVDADRGVLLSVDELETGTVVEFDIEPASGQNTTPATLTAEADEQGVASVSVYGVDAAQAG